MVLTSTPIRDLSTTGNHHVKKSYEVIKEGRGTHFDPDVVDAFFASEDKLLAIKGKYEDAHESLLFQMAGKIS